MAQKYSNLFEGICEFSRLRRAFYRASKGKQNRMSVLNFYARLEKNLFEIRDDLKTGRYEFGPYRSFYVKEPKLRLIESARFRDRVVHHSIHQALEPIFESKFYTHSYACRSGRGTHAALLTLFNWIKINQDKWYLKCDIKKFFPSIDRQILLEIMKKSISDEKLINCMEKLILGAPNRGIPIGNLTSQLLANAYLNELDQFVKRKLRVKHYIRYMDDFVLLATSHEEALSLRDQIKTFLEEKLRLVLSPQKVHIGRCIEGITFVGYRIHPDKIRFRGQSLRRMRKKLYKARVADLATFECKAQSIYSGVLMAYKGQVKYVTNSNTVWRQLTEINFGQLSPKSLAEF